MDEEKTGKERWDGRETRAWEGGDGRGQEGSTVEAKSAVEVPQWTYNPK